MAGVSISSIRPDSVSNLISIKPAPSTGVTPATQIAQNLDSQSIYGIQAITLEGSPLQTNDDARYLAEYLLRPDPTYWFTGLTANMARLDATQRATVAALEIGSVVSVTKTFKYGTPSSVTRYMYVEGIEHRITPSGHLVDLHFSPVTLVTAFILDNATNGTLSTTNALT